MSIDVHRASWKCVTAYFAAGLLVIAAAVACLSAQGCATPVVGSVVIHDIGFVKYNGNVLVVQGEATLDASLYFAGSGLDVIVPAHVEKGGLLVLAKDPKTKIQGKVGDPLPAFCAILFRPGEALELGVTFQAVAP